MHLSRCPSEFVDIDLARLAVIYETTPCSEGYSRS
tara:strand:+ start:994 stop:1098 length:105 start_codon:yes stop_codon:yes gene_type:complete